MPAIQIRWSTLFKLTELDFIPEPPKVLKVLDELQQSIAWLTAATGHDRKLLRCTDQGALLIAGGWSNLAEVETHEAQPDNNAPDTHICTVKNKGVLIATSTKLVLITIKTIVTADDISFYLPPEWLFWYPHPVYSAKVSPVSLATGGSSYVGLTFYD